jgi:hypothetical protein
MRIALGSVLVILALAAPLASAGSGKPAHISWADKKHAFATDPFGRKWKCAPPGARDYVVTLCSTNNDGKSWWIAFSQEWRAKTLDSFVDIFSVWRGPARNGAFDLAGASDAGSGDTVYVTRDGGGNWDPSEAFFAELRHECTADEPAGTVCAGGVHFHQNHAKPLRLVYDLNVCTAPFTSPCEKRTYRMGGWPNGNLTPVQISP